MAGDNGDKKKSEKKGVIDATTDFVRAVLRGSAKGWGSALKSLGEELEKFSEELKTDS